MKTAGFWSSARPEIDEVDQRLPIVIGRAIWENCPILLAIDTVIVIACVPALMLAGAGGLFAVPMLLAFTLGPVWIAALAAAESLLDGERVGIGLFAMMIRKSALSGIRIALVPAAISTVLLGSLVLAGGNGRGWMLAPAFVDGLILSGVVVAGLGTGWLAGRGGEADRALWRRGAILAGSSPQAIGGIVAIAVLIGIAAQLIGPLMIGILSAPFAVAVAAIFRHVAADPRMSPHA